MLEIPWYILVGVMFVCFFIGFCIGVYIASKEGKNVLIFSKFDIDERSENETV